MGGPKVEWRRRREKEKKFREEKKRQKTKLQGGGTMARLMQQLVQVCLSGYFDSAPRWLHLYVAVSNLSNFEPLT